MYKGEENDEEPEWVKNEKEHFSSYRDKNGDGFLDNEEVSSQFLIYGVILLEFKLMKLSYFKYSEFQFFKYISWSIAIRNIDMNVKK